MLVLSRKQQQKITIGDNITVTVLKIKGTSIRIGIEAPEGVRILRGELQECQPAGEPAIATQRADEQSETGCAREKARGQEDPFAPPLAAPAELSAKAFATAGERTLGTLLAKRMAFDTGALIPQVVAE